jgi:hypothetical protein
VIVNHSHQFIFVHVPKAAGTSVSELFSKYSAYSDLEVGGTELGEALQHAYKRRFNLTKHSTAAEIKAVVGDSIWKKYYSFAFVRDPYARAQSTFHFMKRWHGNKEMQRLSFMDNLDDFRSFVMSDVFEKQKAHRLLWPQVRWLQDDNGKQLVDYVGRLETLDEDIHKILTTASGLVKAGAAGESAPKKNRSASTDAALYALLSSDPEVERRIYEMHKADFDTFGYPRFDVKTWPKPEEPSAEAVAEAAAAAKSAAAPEGRAGKAGKANKMGGAGKAGKLKAGKAGGAGGSGGTGGGGGAGGEKPWKKNKERAKVEA